MRTPAVLAVSAALLALPASAPAQGPGALDPSFGEGGRASVRVGGGGSRPSTVVQAPDGRLIVAGIALDPGGDDGFALARFSADGQLDRSFGRNGALVEQLGSGESPYSSPAAVVVEPDGEIIAVGQATSHDGARVAALKVDAAGQVIWRVTHQLADNTNGGWATHAVRRPDGRIVIGGVASRGVVRYAMVGQLDPEDGSLDKSFGTDGYVLESGARKEAPSEPGNTAREGGDAEPSSLVLTPSGRVVLAGHFDSCFRYPCRRPFLQAYGPDGRQDTAFGAGPLGFGSIVELLPAADGSFTAFGSGPESSGPYRRLMGRFTAAGELDRAYAPPEGLKEVGRPSESVSTWTGGFSAQPDGRYLGALITDREGYVGRLLADGTVDRSFGFGGVARTGLGSVLRPLLLPDGRIVAAGVPVTPEGLRDCGGRFSCPDSGGFEEMVLVRLLGGTVAGQASIERSGRVRGRVAHLTVACTATGATDCAGDVKLTSVRTRRDRKRVSFGRVRFSLKAGTTARVEVPLNRVAQRRIRRAGRRLTVRARVANGAAPVAQRRVVLALR